MTKYFSELEGESFIEEMKKVGYNEKDVVEILSYVGKEFDGWGFHDLILRLKGSEYWVPENAQDSGQPYPDGWLFDAVDIIYQPSYMKKMNLFFYK